MAGKKSEMRTVRAPQKKSKEKLTNLKIAKKQTLSKGVGGFNDVDSLIFLKDTKEGKSLKDIDDRITFLKAELKSLIGESKSNKDLYRQDKSDLKDVKCNIIPEKSNDFKESTSSKINEFTPSFSSTPCKFTEWLGKTIDETNSNFQIEGETIHETCNSPVALEVDTFNRFPPNKVEELLYKSFIVQNFGKHLSDLYETGSEDSPRSKAKKENDNKSRKVCKKPDAGKTVQRKNKYCRESKRVKRRRTITLNTSVSDVEVIDLAGTTVNEIARTDPSCIDLEVSNYDWDEPFYVDDDGSNGGTQFTSEVQIINISDTIESTNKKPEESGINQRKSNENPETDKPQPKKVWECPVCFEQSKGQEIVATQCGHIFCKACLECYTSKVKNNCPTCRAELKNKPLIKLFNF